MDDTQGVYWHQGMFLQPQHFQMADLQRQFQAKPLMASGLPHFWGVGELTLIPAALKNRNIEVQSAQLLFPDGCYIEFPGNAVIRARACGADWIEGDRPFMVYLGLKKLHRQASNVALVDSLEQAGSAATRYATLADPVELADLYSDGPPAQVRTLLHVVHVFFENEIDQLQHYDLIPIARLVREGDAIKLADDFVAPCYTLAGSDGLHRMVKDIRDELAGRARQLQIYKSPREMQKAEFDASYLVFLLALRSLNRICPTLFHFTETGQVHPWQVYGVLRQLAGELSSFSERFNMLGEAEDGAAGLPAYDHADLGRCFGRARALIGELLNEITIGPELLVPLTSRAGDCDDYCAGHLSSALFGQRNRFYLVLRTEQDAARTIDAVLHDARLAAIEELPGLIAHSLPGLELIHLAVAPQGLPRCSYSYYFRIEQISRQWDAVERFGTIALQWLDAPADMKADIVVLRG